MVSVTRQEEGILTSSGPNYCSWTIHCVNCGQQKETSDLLLVEGLKTMYFYPLMLRLQYVPIVVTLVSVSLVRFTPTILAGQPDRIVCTKYPTLFP